MKRNSLKSHLLGKSISSRTNQPREAWTTQISSSATMLNGTTITIPERYAESENGESSTCSTLNKRALRAPAYAFILPNLEKYPDDFRRFLERDMIEMATLRRLETSGMVSLRGRLNVLTLMHFMEKARVTDRLVYRSHFYTKRWRFNSVSHRILLYQHSNRYTCVVGHTL